MNIEQIAHAIINLNELDFKEAQKSVDQLSSYFHPLKPELTERRKKVGKHNSIAIEKIRDLRDHLLNGEF